MRRVLVSSAIFATLAFWVPRAIAQQDESCEVPVPGEGFCDDFEDGSAADGSPVTWVRGGNIKGGNSAVVVDGSYRMTTLSSNSSVVEEITSWTDVSIQTQVHADEVIGRYNVGLGGRVTDIDSDGTLDSYLAGINQDGLVFAMIGVDGAANVVVDRFETSLDPTAHDVIMRLEIQGTEIGFSAWEEGGVAPESPMVSFTDDTHSHGTIGLFIGSSNRATFSFRYVDAVPEPSSMTLFVLGLSYIGFLRRFRIGQHS